MTESNDFVNSVSLCARLTEIVSGSLEVWSLTYAEDTASSSNEMMKNRLMNSRDDTVAITP